MTTWPILQPWGLLSCTASRKQGNFFQENPNLNGFAFTFFTGTLSDLLMEDQSLKFLHTIIPVFCEGTDTEMSLLPVGPK